MSPAGVSLFVHQHVLAVQALYGDLVGPDAWVRRNGEQVGLLAARLAEGHHERHLGAFVELHNWHPDLGGHPESDVWDLDLGPADFLLAVALGHGYTDPGDAAGDDRAPSAAFEAAVDTMLGGDVVDLAARLSDEPTLVRGTSHWPHRATLLHYATANGVEIDRQVVPSNLVEVVRLVVERGGDVGATSFAHGQERTPLDLLLSSGHPWLAGVTDAVAEILRSAPAES